MMDSEFQGMPSNTNGYMSNGDHELLSTPQNGDPQQQQIHWNPRHLEIKTRSVEKTLEPLVMQVTTLVSSKSPQKKKGKSKVSLNLMTIIFHMFHEKCHNNGKYTFF